jgi:glutathione S-transferase
MQLYVFPPSTRSFKVIAVAAQLGLDCEMSLVDLSKGAQLAEPYGALNPNRKAPVLVDGDLKLWESNAIVDYLAALRPEAGLSSEDPRARADIARWQYWEAAHWDPGCTALIFERVVKQNLGLGDPDPAAIARGEKEFARCAAVLDAHLRDRRFLTGARLTTADFVVGADLSMTDAAALPVEPFTHVKRWYAELSALPAWQQAGKAAAEFFNG